MNLTVHIKKLRFWFHTYRFYGMHVPSPVHSVSLWYHVYHLICVPIISWWAWNRNKHCCRWELLDFWHAFRWGPGMAEVSCCGHNYWLPKWKCRFFCRCQVYPTLNFCFWVRGHVQKVCAGVRQLTINKWYGMVWYGMGKCACISFNNHFHFVELPQ